MSTTLPQTPPVSTSTSSPPNPLNADYEAARTAHKNQLKIMVPTRRKYDELNLRHKKIQATFHTITAEQITHNAAYQHHKQYVTMLSNALLASNNALRATAPQPYTHIQLLTQATLIHKLRAASETLITMRIQNSRLDSARIKSFMLDQEFCLRCQEFWLTVHNDCQELDRLHANVLKAGTKIGKKSECGRDEGKCFSCTRNADLEARKAAAEAERLIRNGTGTVWGGTRRAAEGRQRLEDIVEEEEVNDGAEA